MGEKYNQLQTLVKGEQSEVFPGAPQGLVFPGDPGVPDSLAPAHNDFSPRLGIAYVAGCTDAVAAQALGGAGRPASALATECSIRRTRDFGGDHERQSAVWVHVYFGRAAAVCLAVYCGRDGRECGPALSAAAGGVRGEPRQIRTTTVNWSQFEPLVGIPAVDPNDKTPYASTGC